MTLTDLYKKTERRASAAQSTESAKGGTESRSSQTIGKLDMVIAFDTTGFQWTYISGLCVMRCRNWAATLRGQRRHAARHSGFRRLLRHG